MTDYWPVQTGGIRKIEYTIGIPCGLQVTLEHIRPVSGMVYRTSGLVESVSMESEFSRTDLDGVERRQQQYGLWGDGAL